MRLGVCLSFVVVLGAAPLARAEPIIFEGLRFDVPAQMVRTDEGPRPDGPFLRLRNGERADPFAEFLEAISGPESGLEGRMSRENYAEIALMPAQRFCGDHQVLRNASRSVDGAEIIDVGYVCLRHSRQPQFSRQVVRTVGVFYEGKFTGFMFVRMWRNTSHPDDQLTAEQWMQPTDAFAESIAPARANE